MVAPLLAAVVEYLTRGRGSANVLAQEMKASSTGAHLGEWMLEHEDGLKNPYQSALDNSGMHPTQPSPPYDLHLV